MKEKPIKIPDTFLLGHQRYRILTKHECPVVKYDLLNVRTGNVKHNVPSVEVYLGVTKQPGIVRSHRLSHEFHIKINKRRR